MQERQGWQRDPFGRYEQRYFSRNTPTALVRTDGVEGRDDPAASAQVTTAPAPEPVVAAEPKFHPRLYRVRRHPVLGWFVFGVLVGAFFAGLIGLSAMPFVTFQLVAAVTVALVAIVVTRSRQRAA